MATGGSAVHQVCRYRALYCSIFIPWKRYDMWKEPCASSNRQEWCVRYDVIPVANQTHTSTHASPTHHVPASLLNYRGVATKGRLKIEPEDVVFISLCMSI